MKSDRLKRLLPLLLALAAFVVATSAQNLQTRLDQQTDFLPSNGSAVEQLIEVAHRFQIPMGIEWLERPEPVANAKPEAGVKSETVLELVTRIVRQFPEHQVLIEDRIVRVYTVHCDQYDALPEAL